MFDFDSAIYRISALFKALDWDIDERKEHLKFLFGKSALALLGEKELLDLLEYLEFQLDLPD